MLANRFSTAGKPSVYQRCRGRSQSLRVVSKRGCGVRPKAVYVYVDLKMIPKG